MTIVVSKYNDVLCAKTVARLFNFRLKVYTYFVDGLLVDTGPSKFAREYIEFFQSQQIRQAVLTHYHEDHSGNAPWLDNYDIPLYIHPKALDICRQDTHLPLYRHFFWGERRGFDPLPLGALLNGKNSDWQVIETPGHSPDHVAIYNRERGIVFTGDLVVTPKPKLILRYESIPQIISSLRKLVQLDFQTVFCAHAGPVANGKEMINTKLNYLENLTGEVLKLHQQGWTVPMIKKKLFPKTVLLTYVSRKEWAAEHIIESIIRDK